MAETKVKVQGVSGAFLLFLVFLVLKLTNVVSWSWWIVTLPLWGGAVLGIGLFLLVFIIAGIASLMGR